MNKSTIGIPVQEPQVSIAIVNEPYHVFLMAGKGYGFKDAYGQLTVLPTSHAAIFWLYQPWSDSSFVFSQADIHHIQTIPQASWNDIVIEHARKEFEAAGKQPSPRSEYVDQHDQLKTLAEGLWDICARMWNDLDSDLHLTPQTINEFHKWDGQAFLLHKRGQLDMPTNARDIIR